MGLIDIIVRLLLGLFSLFFFGVSAVPQRPPEPPPAAFYSVPSLIEEATVNIMESQPVQVSITVRGQHPDGCELPVIVEQTRSDNNITLSIYRELPGDIMCPMILQPYEDTIVLEGNFAPGSYVITVNDLVVEFAI